MKQILIVAQYAPTFGGNFIESMKSLQEAEGISVRYLLPEQAKSCEWISDLTEVHYTDWSFSSLKKVWHELNQDAPVDVVHFHFVGSYFWDYMAIAEDENECEKFSILFFDRNRPVYSS